MSLWTQLIQQISRQWRERASQLTMMKWTLYANLKNLMRKTFDRYSTPMSDFRRMCWTTPQQPNSIAKKNLQLHKLSALVLLSINLRQIIFPQTYQVYRHLGKIIDLRATKSQLFLLQGEIQIVILLWSRINQRQLLLRILNRSLIF